MGTAGNRGGIRKARWGNKAWAGHYGACREGGRRSTGRIRRANWAGFAGILHARGNVRFSFREINGTAGGGTWNYFFRPSGRATAPFFSKHLSSRAGRCGLVARGTAGALEGARSRRISRAGEGEFRIYAAFLQRGRTPGSAAEPKSQAIRRACILHLGRDARRD